MVNCISETMLVNGQESAGNVQKSILEERNEKMANHWDVKNSYSECYVKSVFFFF